MSQRPVRPTTRRFHDQAAKGTAPSLSVVACLRTGALLTGMAVIALLVRFRRPGASRPL